MTEKTFIVPIKQKNALALKAEEVDIFKGQSSEDIKEIVKKTPVTELIEKILLKFNSQ